MSRGLASLRGYQQGGGPLSEYFYELLGSPRKMGYRTSDKSSREEYRDNPYYAFVDTLQSIIGSGGRGAEGDVSVQYGPLPPWARAANAPGWYDPELPLEKEEHQLPPLLNLLPQSTIEPLGRLLGMDKERVYLRRSPPLKIRSDDELYTDMRFLDRDRGVAAHEFGHAFDFRNIISNELENKIIEEYYENPLTSPNQLLKSAGYPDSDWEDDLPINILGHTEKFAQVFGEAVEFLQRLHDEKFPNLLAGQNVTGIGYKYGRPLEHTEGWGVPPYMFTMVQELLKLPHYKDHPLNETHIERDAHSTAWPIVKRHPSLLAQQDVTGIRGIR